MNATERLAELFMHFPGIGPKQAKRFVYYLLREHSHFKEQLIKALEELKFTGKQCDMCFRYFGDPTPLPASTGRDPTPPLREDASRGTAPAKKVCNICGDETRDKATLMLLEKELDMDAIEKTGSYRGLYFILGGLVPPLADKPSELIRIRELASRVHASLEDESLKEMIFALPVTDYGDTTTEYVEKTVKQIVGIEKIKLSHLARGLSSGLELEYVDKNTFSSALERRD